VERYEAVRERRQEKEHHKFITTRREERAVIKEIKTH
jgi:hypothetical protein